MNFSLFKIADNLIKSCVGLLFFIPRPLIFLNEILSWYFWYSNFKFTNHKKNSKPEETVFWDFYTFEWKTQIEIDVISKINYTQNLTIPTDIHLWASHILRHIPDIQTHHFGHYFIGTFTLLIRNSISTYMLFILLCW